MGKSHIVFGNGISLGIHNNKQDTFKEAPSMKKMVLLLVAAALVCFAERPTTKEMRDLWTQRTQGSNLALGKKCQLVPDTDYHLTKSDTDPFDLTDGKFASRTDERLWFYKGTVGWYHGLGHSFIKIDLENVEPVEKLVIRLLGGSDGNFKFPKKMTVHVSKDGKLYHEANSIQKLAPGEKEQCDWKRYYYIEEDLHWGKAWTYPFELSVNAEARYIILEIKAETASIFSDELVVIKPRARARASTGHTGIQRVRYPWRGCSSSRAFQSLPSWRRFPPRRSC